MDTENLKNVAYGANFFLVIFIVCFVPLYIKHLNDNERFYEQLNISLASTKFSYEMGIAGQCGFAEQSIIDEYTRLREEIYSIRGHK